MVTLTESILTPPEARLRLLRVGGVSFPFSFQVVEWVALFRAVFAEEAGDFGIADQDDLI